jgi:membrane protease YdiL (CAAX protease family)
MIRRHPVIVYFALACVISWIGVLPLIASAQGLTSARVPDALHGLGALGPALSALFVTRAIAGRDGLREIARRLVFWRVGGVWLAVAVLSPFALLALAALLLRVFAGAWPAWDGLAAAVRSPAWALDTAIASLVYGFGEEIGWRGFALPRLQARWSALGATAVLASLWALWHVPYFLYRYEYPGPVGLVGFFLGVFAGAIWLTFLLNSTLGSILTVALWHLTWNVAVLAGGAASAQLPTVMTVLVMALAVLIVIFAGPSRLSARAKYLID